MIYIPPSEDNLFERLASKTGLGDLIANFAERLNDEPRAISAAVQSMELSVKHPAGDRAREWGRVNDLVASVAGLKISPAVAEAKLGMENRGVNMVEGSPVTAQIITPELMPDQDQPTPTDTNVFDLSAIRARIDELHIPTAEQLEEVIRPFGLDEAA